MLSRWAQCAAVCSSLCSDRCCLAIAQVIQLVDVSTLLSMGFRAAAVAFHYDGLRILPVQDDFALCHALLKWHMCPAVAVAKRCASYAQDFGSEHWWR